MKMTVALAALLLAVTVACGKQTEAPDAAATPPSPTAAAPTPAPAPETATPAPSEDPDQIEAGEAVNIEGEEQDAPITQRANEQLAQALAPSAPAADGRWTQGVHYRLLVPTQPTNVAPDKVEVVEMFWYGCGHCFALEPYLKNWEKQKPAYVQLTRMPVTWSAGHKAQAQLYYTLAALGKIEALHEEVFKEIQERQNQLIGASEEDTESKQAAFARRHGIAEKDFRDAYRSMGVRTRLARAEELVRRYRVSSVPTIIVNGKYVTDVSMAKGQNELIALINDLAAREQKKQ